MFHLTLIKPSLELSIVSVLIIPTTKQHKLHHQTIILEVFSLITDKIFSGAANFPVK